MPTIIAGVEFKTWDEMSELEQLACQYSDYYKEAHGFRPRGDVSGWTVEDYKKEFEYLGRVCEANEKERQERQQAATVAFEALVVKLVTVNGVKDRAAAIRHLAEAERVGNDMEYLRYCLGLPYGYFAK